MMEPIKNLPIGTEFYFSDDKATIFQLQSFQTRKNGAIRSAACLTPGKLYPVYISAAKQVNVLKTPVLNKAV